MIVCFQTPFHKADKCVTITNEIDGSSDKDVPADLPLSVLFTSAQSRFSHVMTHICWIVNYVCTVLRSTSSFI